MNLNIRKEEHLQEIIFLVDTITLKINNYKEYLEYIQNWDNLTHDEQEQLRQWYRDYYQKTLKERKRYREYYSSNADLERERVKRARIKVSKILRNSFSLIKNQVGNVFIILRMRYTAFST